MLVPGWVSSRCAEGVLVVWERELAAGGWSNGGEPEEEVASGVVGVWEQVLGELGLVGGGAVSSGRRCGALGGGGAWLGVFKGEIHQTSNQEKIIKTFIKHFLKDINGERT